MREYYRQKKEAAKVGMTLISSNGGENHVSTTFKPGFEQADKPLVEQGLTDFKPFKPTKDHIAAVVLCAFILANTAFLVNEQIRYYLTKGYTVWYALFVALLSEVSVILLAFFGKWATGWRKVQVYLTLMASLFCTLSVVYLGIDRTQSEEQKNAEIIALMREEIEVIRPLLLEKPKLAPRLLKKEEDLRTFLQANRIAIGPFETWVLTFIRVLSLLWNIVFAGLVGGLIKGKRISNLL
jgi:hypothetical protein